MEACYSGGSLYRRFVISGARYIGVIFHTFTIIIILVSLLY